MTAESILESVKGLPLEEQQTKVYDLYISLQDEENYEDAIVCGIVLMNDLELHGVAYDLPRVFNLAEQYGRTIASFEDCIDDPSFEDIFIGDVEVPYNLSLAYFATGDLKNAIKCFKKTYDFAQYNVNNYSEDNDHDKDFYLFISANCLAFMGTAYCDLDDIDNSIECLNKSTEIFSTPVAFYQMGIMFYRTGTPELMDRAIDRFETIADLSQKKRPGILGYTYDCITNSNYYLGLIYADVKKDTDAALMRLKRAKELGYKITDSEINEIIARNKTKKRSFFKNLFK